MVGKNSNRGMNARDERLDELGAEVIRASSFSEAETKAAASSPFLYSRIRSRISAEHSRRVEKENWLSMLIVSWRAVPAMALVAVICLVLFWSASSNVLSTPGFVEESLLSSTETGIEGAVFADRQPLSSDEVLDTLLNREDGEVTR